MQELDIRSSEDYSEQNLGITDLKPGALPFELSWFNWRYRSKLFSCKQCCAIFLLNLNSIFLWYNSSICSNKICQRFLRETMDNYSGHEELFTENFITRITHRGMLCVLNEWKILSVMWWAPIWVRYLFIFLSTGVNESCVFLLWRDVRGWPKCVIGNRGVTNAVLTYFICKNTWDFLKTFFRFGSYFMIIRNTI